MEGLPWDISHIGIWAFSSPALYKLPLIDAILCLIPHTREVGLSFVPTPHSKVFLQKASLLKFLFITHFGLDKG